MICNSHLDDGTVCITQIHQFGLMSKFKFMFKFNVRWRSLVLESIVAIFCLSNRKFERLGGPLDEIVTVFVHKYSVIMSRPNMTL